MTEDILLSKHEITYAVRDEGDDKAILDVLRRYAAELGEPRDLVKIRLAYAIKKLRFAFLGSALFAIDPHMIEPLNGDLRLCDVLLRHLITEPLPMREVQKTATQDSATVKISSISDGFAGMKSSGDKTHTVGRGVAAPLLTNEALEKKIEEILNK